MDRRHLLLAPMLAPFLARMADASPIDPAMTTIIQHGKLPFGAWTGLPPHSGEMAKLYGDPNEKGLYLVMMRWNPGWFSAPHSYATDRIQVVVSGTWYVNSGRDFDPGRAVPVPAGGFVERHRRTFHYDGAPANAAEPAVIAVFGEGPVEIELAEPGKPSWRKV